MKKHCVWLMVAVMGLGGLSAAWAQDATPDSYVQYENTVRPLQKQLFDKRYALEELYRSGNQDDAQVQGLINEIAQLQAQLMAERARMRASDDFAYGSHYRDNYGHHGRGRGGRMGGGGHWGGGGRGCW